MFKNYYYNFAKANASSIEEIDCLIEEYKNIKKISIPNSCALVFSLSSIFLVAFTSLFSAETNLKVNIFSKLVDYHIKSPNITEQELKELDTAARNLGFQETSRLFGEFLSYILLCTFAIVAVSFLYNNF
ncbi:hypothetical protein D2A91_13880, partial [Enterococcus faecalis]|nr:hypothetical protein [Enterococcus faecalis]